MEKADKLILCLDMHGCPNRCRHCWLGNLPNAILEEPFDEEVVNAFSPYFKQIEFYSWLREPDYFPSYRKRWERDCALSSSKPKRFELASFFLLSRDPEYVKFLKEVGTEKVQLTFFGLEATTDRYIGRAGAYQELLKATQILKDNGIAPRYQMFINEENKEEIVALLSFAKKLEIPEIIIHEGTCDGANRALYDIRIQKSHIPDEVKPYFLDYPILTSEAELYASLKDDTSHYVPSSPQGLVLYMTSDKAIYHNYTNPHPAYLIGVYGVDSVESIVKKALENDIKALREARRITIGELVRRYGNEASDRVFSPEDYKMYLLNTHLGNF